MLIPSFFRYAAALDIETVMSKVKPIVQNLLSSTGGATGGLGNIGIGLASVFLLVVVFVYTSSILEGGRFQAKMALPLIIYFLVANFNIVSSVTVGFVSRLQSTCINACHQHTQNIVQGKSLLEFFYDRAVQPALGKNPELSEKVRELKETLGDLDANPGSDPVESSAGSTGSSSSGEGSRSAVQRFIDNIVGHVTQKGEEIDAGLERFWLKSKYHFYRGLALFKERKTVTGSMGFINFSLEAGFSWLITLIIQWIASIVAGVYSLFGAVMMGILVAFGPITWAFAVFPGQQRIIGSWFIRLCQFALYAPIVALCNAFVVSTMEYQLDASMAGASGSADMLSSLMIIVTLVLEIVAITSTPQIASMIIEGASGGVSIQQGLNAMTSPLRTVSSWVNAGEKSRDTQALTVATQQMQATQQVNQTLTQILKKMGTGGKL